MVSPSKATKKSPEGTRAPHRTDGPVEQLWVPPVQGAHADGEGDVVGRFVLEEPKVLDRHAAELEGPGSQRIAGCGPRRGDGRGRAIDAQDVPTWPDSARYFLCGGPGARPDLQHPKAGPQRQGVHHGQQAGGEVRHYSSVVVRQSGVSGEERPVTRPLVGEVPDHQGPRPVVVTRSGAAT